MPVVASLDDVLAARDERQQVQQALLLQGSVVSLTVLAVGAVKRSAFLDTLLSYGECAVVRCFAQKDWQVLATHSIDASGGASVLWAVNESPMVVKAAMLRLEESSPIGRLWDIDVLDRYGRPLSRVDFGYSPRRCLCCDNAAKVCARARCHTLTDIQAAMKARFQLQKKCEQIGQVMCDALKTEVRLTPKPGLVDSRNCGPHPDMTLADFECSADALLPYFIEFAALGACHDATPELFSKLRHIGLAAEAAMFAATGGVNTHKGAIFALGLWAAVATIGNWMQAADAIAKMCVDLPKEYGVGDSAGARIYRTYGLTGARGEAVSGFMHIRQYALPAYDRAFAATADRYHALRYALLTLLAYNDDTTTVCRGGMAGLCWLQTQAKALLSCAELLTKPSALVKVLERLDQQCIERNLSTGGSADLLAITIFLTDPRMDRKNYLLF